MNSFSPAANAKLKEPRAPLGSKFFVSLGSEDEELGMRKKLRNEKIATTIDILYYDINLRWVQIEPDMTAPTIP